MVLIRRLLCALCGCVILAGFGGCASEPSSEPYEEPGERMDRSPPEMEPPGAELGSRETL